MKNSIHLLPSLEDILKRYIDLGFYILPVYPKAKNPIGKDHFKTASNDIKKVLKMAEENPGCNWGMMPNKSGLVVMDVDAHKGGLEVWDHIKGDLSIKTMTARTPRGGLHLIFKSKPDLLYGNPFKDDGLDCQHANIIVINPSVNADNVQYTWIDESPIQDFPSELETLFARRKGAEQKEAPKLIGAKSFFEKIALQLKTKELDYSTWVSIGMSLHSAMPTDEGLHIWQDISKGPSWKEGDEDACATKWNGFQSSRTDGLSYRSLRFIAKELGCEVPSLTLEEDKYVFANIRQKMQLEADNNPGWFTEENTGRIVCRHKDFIVQYLNEMNFFVQTEEMSGAIGQLIIHPNQYKNVNYIKGTDFKTLVDNRFLKTYTQKANGDWVAKYTPISKLWLDDPRRSEFKNIHFGPNPPKGFLDLTSPFPLTPIKATKEAIEPFLELIIEGVADGNYDKGLYLIQWLAHIIQKPWERSSIVPVLIGEQGTGKGMLFDQIMAKLLGHYHYKIMTAQTLKERFNAEQAMRLLTFIDESTWRGDKAEDGILKGLTGSPQMTIERKFGGRQAVPNYSRYAIASNNMEAVSIERSNRRYLVFEMNSKFKHKHKLFETIGEGLHKGVMGNHLMGYLLDVNIAGFNPNKFVDFGDGQGQQAKVASSGIEALFWEDYFKNPQCKLWLGDKLLKSFCYAAFLRFAKEINTYERNLNEVKFWKKTYDFFGINEAPELKIRMGSLRQRYLAIGPTPALENFNEVLKIKIPRDFLLEEVTLTEREIEGISKGSEIRDFQSE